MLDFDAVNPKYPIPDYLYVGQEVAASKDGKVIQWCKVAIAFGNAAWVEFSDGEQLLINRYKLRIRRQ